MIDRDLLKQLGWSDDLISEVTRGAAPLRDVGAQIVAPPMLVALTSSISTSLYYDKTRDGSSQEFRTVPH